MDTHIFIRAILSRKIKYTWRCLQCTLLFLMYKLFSLIFLASLSSGYLWNMAYFWKEVFLGTQNNFHQEWIAISFFLCSMWWMNGIRNSGCWLFRNCFAVKKRTEMFCWDSNSSSKSTTECKNFQIAIDVLLWLWLVSQLQTFYFFFPPFRRLPFESHRRSNELWLENSIALSYVTGNGIRFVGKEISFFQLHKQFEFPDCRRSVKNGMSIAIHTHS